jgi:threonine/homoserine/homoserine lactone efflux protein
MSLDTALAIIGFAFVMSISPGPSNFILLASSANFGFARSIPSIIGFSSGFLSMIFVVGLGLGQILEKYPLIYTTLRVICGIYVLWMAFKIAKSKSLGADSDEEMSKPISFFQAASFQLVNPKAWAVALIVTVSYTTKDDYLFSLIAMIGVFATVNLPCIGVWALSGAGLRKILAKGQRIVAFNISMAVLLIVSMIPVLLSQG